MWDIGANIGFFTVLAATLVGDQGHVLAVEPLPENIAALRGNIARNGLTDRTAIIEVAVSDRTGRAALHIFDEQTWARLGDATGHASEIEVDVMTLDDLFDRHPAPKLVKMDIEGGEYDALVGAETLLRHRPELLIELHGTNKEVTVLLKSAGYIVTRLGSATPVHEADWQPDDWACHILAVPREVF